MALVRMAKVRIIGPRRGLHYALEELHRLAVRLDRCDITAAERGRYGAYMAVARALLVELARLGDGERLR